MVSLTVFLLSRFLRLPEMHPELAISAADRTARLPVPVPLTFSCALALALMELLSSSPVLGWYEGDGDAFFDRVRELKGIPVRQSHASM